MVQVAVLLKQSWDGSANQCKLKWFSSDSRAASNSTVNKMDLWLVAVYLSDQSCIIDYTPTSKMTWDLGQQFPVGGWLGIYAGLFRPPDWLVSLGPPASHPHIAATGQELAGRGRRRLAGWLACFPWRRRQPNRAHLTTSALPFQCLTLWWYWRSISLFSACELWFWLGRWVADADVATETKLCILQLSQQVPSFMCKLECFTYTAWCTLGTRQGRESVWWWNKKVPS